MEDECRGEAESVANAVIGARFGSEIVLVDVELNDAGVSRQRRDCVETDYPVQDLGFCSVAAAPLSDSAQARGGDSAFLRQRTALLAAAEIAGACRRMVQMTRDYLLLRSQFGQVLGANQALKHALADNYVKVEALIAAIEYAAAAVDAGAIDAEVSVCAAKHYAGRAGKAVADSTLQMHGAIGYTMEFPLHRFMKRVFRLSVSHGSGRIQGERLFEMFRQQV